MQRGTGPITRRRWMQVGALGALGLSLPELLHHRARAADASAAPAQSAILVWLGGGPSHHDTFDPKPGAVAEIRGQYRPIPTTVPGVQLAESLPRLAQQMSRLAVIRSVTHPDAAHEPGVIHMQSGTAFRPGSNPPSMGAVTGYERQDRPRDSGLPPFVSVPGGDIGAGHLGPAFNPFAVGGDPNAPDFEVQDLGLFVDEPARRRDRRRALLETVNARFRAARPSDVQQAADRFTAQAWDLLTTPQARAAFEIRREPEAIRDGYGRTTLGQGLLMARRLVEAGVPFVTVSDGDWDHHREIYPSLAKKLPPLDQGLGALLSDLDERGRLESTLVIVMGEFGRTPKINVDGGRDHWSRAFSIAMAGGGVRGGRVIGASDAEGAFVAERPVAPEDVAHSVYRLLGIDPEKELPSVSGRRIPIVRDGTFLKDLVT